MIFQNFYNLLFFLFLLIRSQELSKKCVCGHARSQTSCENSGLCIWQNGVCVLNNARTYIEENQEEKLCKNFAEEDCRIQKQCGFYLGQCNNFIDCLVFQKDECQQSSYRCVSDGTKCVEMLECKDYKTEIGCSNKNSNGGYCFWVKEMRQKCREVIICEELPIYLTRHDMCKQGLDGCTVNEQGYGCIKQKDLCTQYFKDFQCFESKQKTQNCFWDIKNGKCVERICENLPFTYDYECKSYLSDCTSNGIHCIERKQCSDAQNKFGCVTDAQGNKCEYHKNQCKIKTCETALDSLKNYQQCQDYDNLLDCVTSENGGCKQRPQTCGGYVNEVDCYSIKQQDCIWQKNKCEKRECNHAPLYFSQTDCKQYGNCIGKVDGGCQQTPNVCEEILLEQFCEFNYNSERCIWLQGKCTLLECNKLKLPTFKNHIMCQEASSSCTFNLDNFGCKDYICENIQEIEFCQIDSKGKVCQINQGCIDKKCLTAPPNYESNQQCEEWLPFCTVNVQELSNSKLLIGCVDKNNQCELAQEEQCYSTFQGIKCKWDKVGNLCIYSICTDADPNIYLTNVDCNSYKVLEGTCIIGTPGFGCQLWPNACDDLISQQQCEVNLQDGTKCFWTGSLCKLLECSDASPLNYTNNFECNSWLDYCIFNHILGGCMIRPSYVDCTSSPNDIMYDTHFECQAWNPKCTVSSSFNSEGCELKKAQCSDYIRQRNCKTNLAGQQCFWNDFDQKCLDQSGDDDCSARIYGDLSHENCENFLKKCTVGNITRSCTNLLDNCDYLLEQQCVITRYRQPCKWDAKNHICKNVLCSDNMTAQTEVECLQFKFYRQCQLKIHSSGQFGPGCEDRPYFCHTITDPLICKLTLTIENHRCYYFNFRCQYLDYRLCEVIQDSKSNEDCQLYNTLCVLQSSGQGCYSILNCSDLSNNVCKSAIMKFNNKCNYYGGCYLNQYCNYQSIGNCEGRKAGLGQRCHILCEDSNCDPFCVMQKKDYQPQFQSFQSFQERSKQCQDYSSNYRYVTSCQCCQSMNDCSQQQGGQQLCDSSIAISSSISICGYDYQTNTCQNRICEHISYINYPVITDQICFDWKYDCVLSVSGCIGFTGNCSLIKLIYQCYSLNCYWQSSKCVNHIDCQINTTAVTNRECLLVNPDYCRLNYTKGFGCAHYSCYHIKEETICNSSNLYDGQNCKWINGSCQFRSCSDNLQQSECESSYQSYFQELTKCFWCQDGLICSINKYCNQSSMISPNSHQDCNNLNQLLTIQFISSVICIIKKSSCSSYTYKDACVSTIDGVDCQWSSGICENKCEAVISSSNKECYDWNSNCMYSNQQCKPLDCLLLTVMVDCNIYSSKCFWEGSTCKTISDCSNYSTSTVCSNNNNSEGIPCFWNSTQCIEKTCQNIPTTPSSFLDCNNWNTNCQFNANDNTCVEDCTSADNSHITHDQCESYYVNKSCTVKLDLIQCVNLPISCGLAKETQCYLDRDGNQCYYSKSTQLCLNLTCSNLDTDFTSHEKCNQKFKQCTVNTTLNGCQQLNDCNSYSIQEQCYLDQNNFECQWIKSKNICKIKECSSAQINQYTAFSCRQYFNDSCTVNKNLDGCEIGQSFCMSYNYQQCISDGQINLKGVECFWNEERNICQERICTNGPSNATSHSEYSACASIFEDKRCVTNGFRCVLRKDCQDVTIIDGCTFDINLNPCIWIDEKCQAKTCQTAEVTLLKYEECNSYLPYCTVNQDGGCTDKQSCQDYEIKEACYADSENFQCIWDINLNKCFSYQCIDYCGNGIVTNQDEQCDDGNYLPYDGCYKCQFQCPQGCNICNGRQCQECNKNGWQLVEGVCSSKCGDGVAVGNEQCDDGNNIEFDGCYQCSYQCSEMCVDCFQGQCILCKDGFVEDGPKCKNICGDGYLVQQYEQCDDGNHQNNDGCTNTCKVENNWKCSTDHNFSFCSYAILPKIILTKLSKTDTTYQEFKLSFSEPVCLNEKGISEEQFLQLIFVQIQNVKDNDYDIEIKSMISISTQLSDVAYKILINFNTNVQNPVLQVKINSENIVNNQGNTLFSKEAKLEFRSSYKMSAYQLSLMSKTSMLSKIWNFFFMWEFRDFMEST
ncbi:unnamed protein product [Paramecium octaurelia]|uniref:Uncharacterized protein n=1 Tax=Paramecium octaurelia TaxID=43137 RepID=A0A8S1WQE9_PAROT|nr:unnamed protein product [Paramecium octaurelia]